MPVRPSDAAAIRALIANQIAAFAGHDKLAAYEATAPNVRRKFPTPAVFDAMTQAAYAPLHRAEQEDFGEIRGGGATAIQAETWSQSVEIATRDGERWTAVYGLERQPGGAIAITSCVLIQRAAAAS